MTRFDRPNINTRAYWDAQHGRNPMVDFRHTLRQDVYLRLVNGGARVLELGCGLSPFCMLAARRGLRVVGLDQSIVAIEALRRAYSGVAWCVGDARRVPFPDARFDTVVAGELIEHLEEPERLLAEMDRLCRPRGRLILSTPQVEFDDPEHLWEFDAAYFEARGFQTETVPSDLFQGRSYLFAWRTR
jgi:2-polyprenyl-3-methyl-5-hydroxy-6-metoxy-1,4-benzoquinol methylase